jgi:hypothetical protein
MLARRRRTEAPPEAPSGGAGDERGPRLPTRIFFSYRRQDSPDHASRLHEALTARFGADSVFVDIDTIEPGQDFLHAVRAAIRSCDVLVAMIGPSWLNARDPSGRQRLRDPDDVVRFELRCAFYDRRAVIPVLVDNAPMVQADELPSDLVGLATRNAFAVSDVAWAQDVTNLLDHIQHHLQERAAAKGTVSVWAPSVMRSVRRRRWPWRDITMAATVALVALPVLLVVTLAPWNSSAAPSPDLKPKLTGTIVFERHSNDNAWTYIWGTDVATKKRYPVLQSVTSDGYSPVWLVSDRIGLVGIDEGGRYYAKTVDLSGELIDDAPLSVNPTSAPGPHIESYVLSLHGCPFRGWSQSGPLLLTVVGRESDGRFSLVTRTVNGTNSRLFRKIILDRPTSMEPLEVVWSPSGARMLVTMRVLDGYRVYVMSADGSAFSPLPVPSNLGPDNTIIARQSFSPAWSPDERKVAFVSPDPTNLEQHFNSIYVVDLRSGALTQLTTGEPAQSPTWSPDGASIAFVEGSGGRERIFATSADGRSAQVRVSQDPTGISDLCPSWGPHPVVGR